MSGGESLEPKVEIRAMELGDCSAVIAFWKKVAEGIFLSAADSVEKTSDFLKRNPGMSFLALCEGEVVGTALCGEDGLSGHIYHLAVDDQHRRKKLGTNLVDKCLQALKKAEISICHLGFTESNLVGESFWLSLGWRKREGFKLMHADVL